MSGFYAPVINALKKARKVFVITGAGVSAESGIPTFRGKDGLWRNYNATQLATPEAFGSDPVLVWRWYLWRRSIIADAKPNSAHRVLAEWERLFPEFLIATQNVDRLHQSAGSKKVVEIHGNIWEVRCTKTGRVYSPEEIEIRDDELPPKSPAGGLLRPNVVWFGEIPYFLNEIDEIIKKADYFLVVGTSGVVYPAAQFLYIAKMRGAKTIGVNLEAPENKQFIDEFHQGKSGEILPDLVNMWIKT